jgi:hypothetical protein
VAPRRTSSAFRSSKPSASFPFYVLMILLGLGLCYVVGLLFFV